MSMIADKRKCLWLALDTESQLRLYTHPDLDMYIPISLNQIVNLTQLNRLPAAGEMIPIWLKISYDLSDGNKGKDDPHVRVQTSARAGACTTQAPAPEPCTSACTTARVDREKTTKEETTKESSTKKEENKKRRKKEQHKERKRDPKFLGADGAFKEFNNAADRGEPETNGDFRARGVDNLRQRQQTFWNMCVALADRYDRDTIELFFGYWSEPDADGIMRCENEKYFDVARRMARFVPDRGHEMEKAVAAKVRRELRRRDRSTAAQRGTQSAATTAAAAEPTVQELIEQARRDRAQQQEQANQKERNREEYLRSKGQAAAESG